MSFNSRRQRQTTKVRQPASSADNSSNVFRRSRTLTGSLSSSVDASMPANAHLRSPRLKTHQLRQHRRMLLLAIAGLLTLAAGTLWLLNQYILTTSISFAMASTAPKQEYQSIIDKYLAGRPLERFRFVLNDEQLQAYLVKQAPEVAMINIDDNKGLASANITIQLRRPVAVWRLSDKTYFVDASGEAFEKSYFASPAVKVNDTSGLPPSSQRLLASSRLLRFIGQTVSALNKQGLGIVKEVTIPPSALKQVDIMLEGRPYRIKMNTDREVVGQVSDAASALRFLDQQSISPQYVDVRVAGKAYYL